MKERIEKAKKKLNEQRGPSEMLIVGLNSDDVEVVSAEKGGASDAVIELSSGDVFRIDVKSYGQRR